MKCEAGCTCKEFIAEGHHPERRVSQMNVHTFEVSGRRLGRHTAVGAVGAKVLELSRVMALLGGGRRLCTKSQGSCACPGCALGIMPARAMLPMDAFNSLRVFGWCDAPRCAGVQEH